jgi:hypothetical protein
LSGALLLLSVAMLLAQDKPTPDREQIGKVLGKPVYRDEIKERKGVSLEDELHRLLSPAMQEYYKAHKAEIEPTKEELDAATVIFDTRHRERIKDEEAELRKKLKAIKDKLGQDSLSPEENEKLELDRLVIEAQLKPPGRRCAEFVLGHWKFQKHLYDNFGGGRILWQQRGQEAFDAHRKWLEHLEKQGKFEITDAELRAKFYEYWTTKNHGAFLTDDKERIRKEFLEPEWAPKPTKKD